jgi:hypothetical protein
MNFEKFRQAAREIAPLVTKLLVFRKGDACGWSWVRMRVLDRAGYRCRYCGQQGDEITLRVCALKTQAEKSKALVVLCPLCERRSKISRRQYEAHA